jgi:glycosyltransferase involved in cell wall biosynthesis
MACSVPVVASRAGGLPEVIEDGVTGFLHAPDDLEGMAGSAVRLLSDPAVHGGMADAARAVARERYTEDRIVPEYERFYEEILRRPPGV